MNQRGHSAERQSRVRGVHWDKVKLQWVVYMGKTYLGHVVAGSSEEEVEKARLEAVKIRFKAEKGQADKLCDRHTAKPRLRLKAETGRAATRRTGRRAARQSGVWGVWWDKAKRQWVAYLGAKYLGHAVGGSTEREIEKARLAAVKLRRAAEKQQG